MLHSDFTYRAAGLRWLARRRSGAYCARMKAPGYPIWLCCIAAGVSAALIWSGVAPHDRLTWLMEVLPVFVALPLLALTYRRFPLTPLLYVLIAVHAVMLVVGGAYTYARVPLGFWLQDIFSLSRNPYDKIGHFMQGLVPALIAREILLRGGFVTGRRMLGFLSLCVALSVSAVYELIEWVAALVMGEGAEQFLGMQGDAWDTQSDMFLALLGGVLSLFMLGRTHDRQIDELRARRA